MLVDVVVGVVGERHDLAQRRGVVARVVGSPMVPRSGRELLVQLRIRQFGRELAAGALR